MPNFQEQLKDLLLRDLEDLSNLESLLASEKHHLIARDHKEVDNATKNKDVIIKQIEARAKTKAQLLAKSGLGIKPGRVTEALAQLNNETLLDLWKQSVDQLKRCKELNEINGKVISISLSRTNKLMSIIRGQSSAPALYGQKGKSQTMSGSHILGKA